MAWRRSFLTKGEDDVDNKDDREIEDEVSTFWDEDEEERFMDIYLVACHNALNEYLMGLFFYHVVILSH